MAYKKVEREDLTTRVARQLRASVLDSTYQPGDRLPPERDLAVEFGVDRNTLRSAIQELEQLGLVERRQGSGCWVLNYRETGTLELLQYLVFKPGTDELDPDIVRSMYEIMLVTLEGVVDLAVQRATADDLASVSAALDALVAAVEASDVVEVDQAELLLTRRIIRAAHSPAAELVANTYLQVQNAVFDPNGNLRLLWAQHLLDASRLKMYRRAVIAFERRDADAAKQMIDVITGPAADLVAAQMPPTRTSRPAKRGPRAKKKSA